LRQVFEDLTPGWHMNKNHRNTVKFDGDVSDDELKRRIRALRIALELIDKELAKTV